MIRFNNIVDSYLNKVAWIILFCKYFFGQWRQDDITGMYCIVGLKLSLGGKTENKERDEILWKPPFSDIANCSLEDGELGRDELTNLSF